MSDFNTRAAKGQAFNLAMEDVRKNDKEGDMKYLATRFLYHYDTAALFQKADAQELATIVGKPEVIELFNQLHKAFDRS